MEIDPKKQQLSDSEDLPSNAKQNHNLFSSAYSESSKQYWGAVPKLTSSQKIQILKKLTNDGFFFNPQQFSFELKYFITKIKTNSVSLSIQLGNFRTDISLLFSSMKLKSVSREIIASGAFGQVCAFSCEGAKICAKKMFMKFTKVNQKSIITEIFLAKLLSSMGIGPKFLLNYGYDALVFNSQIQFLMEFCPIRTHSPNFTCQELKDKVSANLIKNLSILHSIKLLHRDFKPCNIGWSESAQKYIFLDFGLSTFIKEEIGCKTYITSYLGTYAYMTPEIKKAFLLKKPIDADLYYNDLFALLLTIQQIQRDIEVKYCSWFEANDNLKGHFKSEWQRFLPMFLFEYAIFRENIQQVPQLVTKYPHFLHIFKKMAVSFSKKYDNPSEKTYFRQIHAIIQSISVPQVSQQVKASLQKIQADLFQQIYSAAYTNPFLECSKIEFVLNFPEEISPIQQSALTEKYFSYFFNQNEPSQAFSRKKTKQFWNFYVKFLKKQPKQKEFVKIYDEIIQYFRAYFYEIKNIGGLQKITDIFLLLQEIEEQDKTNQMILEMMFVCPHEDEFEKIFMKLISWIIPKKIPKNRFKKAMEYLHQLQLLKNNEKVSKVLEILELTQIIFDDKHPGVEKFVKILQEKLSGYSLAIKKAVEEILDSREKKEVGCFQVIHNELLINQWLTIAENIFQPKEIDQISQSHGSINNEEILKVSVFFKKDPILHIRQSIWHLFSYYLNKDNPKFIKCFEMNFQNICRVSILTAIQLFIHMRYIFFKVSEESEEFKKCLISFIQELKIKEMVEQCGESWLQIRNALLYLVSAINTIKINFNNPALYVDIYWALVKKEEELLKILKEKLPINSQMTVLLQFIESFIAFQQGHTNNYIPKLIEYLQRCEQPIIYEYIMCELNTNLSATSDCIIINIQTKKKFLQILSTVKNLFKLKLMNYCIAAFEFFIITCIEFQEMEILWKFMISFSAAIKVYEKEEEEFRRVINVRPALVYAKNISTEEKHQKLNKCIINLTFEQINAMPYIVIVLLYSFLELSSYILMPTRLAKLLIFGFSKLPPFVYNIKGIIYMLITLLQPQSPQQERKKMFFIKRKINILQRTLIYSNQSTCQNVTKFRSDITTKLLEYNDLRLQKCDSLKKVSGLIWRGVKDKLKVHRRNMKAVLKK